MDGSPLENDPTAQRVVTIHWVGLDCRASNWLRQRCAWCGLLLEEWDLANVAVPEGQEGLPPMWPAGSLVAVDGNMRYPFTPEPSQDPQAGPDDLKIPDGACFQMDPTLTGRGGDPRLVPCAVCQGPLWDPVSHVLKALLTAEGWQHQDSAVCAGNLARERIEQARAAGQTCTKCGQLAHGQNVIQVGPTWCDGEPV